MFNGKRVLITGGTSGIGEACVRRFAQENARVLFVGRNRERGQRIEDELENCDVRFIEADVTERLDIDNIYEVVNTEWKGLDVLFSNAGTLITNPIESLTLNEIEKTFQTNLYSGIYLFQKFIDTLQESSDGNLVVNASINGLQSYTIGRANYAYSASKAALIKAAQLLALNYAGKVRINIICPGITDTPQYTNRDFSRFEGVIPMGRLAEANEIAEVVLFLASERASYMTGSVVVVDGGASLR